ncbi:MAG: ribosome biogenesis factor YjgA [Azoarcus sp.]|jgi:ribosome-associated protein|nr:ribosome biogenesis factor YjgA [Azoarcus sp.]MDX9838098.1 ribosome biogenesis factor YjgA [Azoarcus sp.]
MVSHADSPRSNGPQDDESELEPPSKSSRKRAMQALQDLGAELVALPPSRLRKVPLPESLFVAIRDAQRLTRRDEALRRQMQYIGKLMRSVDPEPIQAQLELFRGASSAEVARQHRLEKLRSDLVEDEKVIEYVVETWPEVDIQHLRTLRRNAIKEREHNKPPKAFREIFKVLRDLDRAGAAEDAGDEDEPDDSDDVENA